MRKLLFATLAAVALACPRIAIAQQQTAPYSGRGPNTLTFSVVGLNDTATIYLTGSSWASVYWTIATAGSGAITTEVSIDGGVNWLPSAYSKRLDATSANPSTAPWANNGPVAGTYETPLPANCTAFRIRYQTAGTATSGTLTPGAAYAPGSTIKATLYDVTGGTASALDTGTVDLSGWTGAIVDFVASGATATSCSYNVIDDAGVALPVAAVSTTALGWMLVFGPVWSNSTTAIGKVNLSALGPLPKRGQFTMGAVTAQTDRIRIEAWR